MKDEIDEGKEDQIMDKWQERENEVLRRNIRNIWHCESNQSIFIILNAIGSDMRLYESDIHFINNSRKLETR